MIVGVVLFGLGVCVGLFVAYMIGAWLQRRPMGPRRRS